MTKPESEFAK